MREGMKAAGRKLPESHAVELIATSGVGLSYAALACIVWHFSFVAVFGFASVTMLMIVFVVYHAGDWPRESHDN
jgi:hypothetical protein